MKSNPFSNLFNHILSESHMTFKNLFALLAVLFALLPSSARAEQWESMKAGNFACGSSTKYEPGAVTAQEAAEASARDWDSCVAKYGLNGCFVQPKGTTTNVQCDYKSRHDPTEEALALARASAVLNIFRSLRPEAGNHDRIAPTMTMVDRSVKYGYLVIMPSIGAVEVSYACNNGKDDDGDGKVDMADVGCESPTDNDEWNAKPLPSDQDALWANLVPVIMAEASTPCPVTVTGWWEIAQRPQGDGEYHFHYDVSYGPCTCRTGDVSEKKGFQMLSPGGIAKAATAHKDPVVESATAGKMTWSELRIHIQSPERSPGVEYVTDTTDEAAEDTTMWFGRAADINDRGDMIIVDFKSLCDEVEAAQYAGIDGIGGASGGLGFMAMGMGNYLQTMPVGSAFAEGGIEFGSPKVSGIITLGLGHVWDTQCMMNDAWAGQFRLGIATNRSGSMGLYAGGRVIYSVIPSVSSEGNEALGPNSFVGLVEAGPRFAFGRGVKNGFFALTATSAADMRYIDPDADGLTTKALGLDLGVAGWLGVDF